MPVTASSRGAVAETEWDATVVAEWLLRVGCAWCFIGHGAWGLYQKEGWLPFYHAFGIADSVAWPTMPLIGLHDIALGIAVLVYPSRALLAWMGVWCLFTALLRPIAGMGWWEFLERGGNYAPPLALLALAGTGSRRSWWARIEQIGAVADRAAIERSALVLRLGIASLLIGHGGFAAFEAKQYLAAHWAAVGIDVGPSALAAIGWAEIAAGVAVLFARSTVLLAAVAAWKVATELLYPIAGRPMDVFEFIERGGDYFAPLALIALLAAKPGRSS